MTRAAATAAAVNPATAFSFIDDDDDARTTMLRGALLTATAVAGEVRSGWKAALEPPRRALLWVKDGEAMDMVTTAAADAIERADRWYRGCG
ncbi:hypothetical protein, partial [Acinetobacter baumannii]|uniref:hypothetical protein n=1 Tax=Acinetobacter baumannii TaxID=470 RepID=UPI00339458C3